tara:strand:- start:212 stop:694 length:483 start_codon:yes stop_codon:yes gene_type:complete
MKALKLSLFTIILFIEFIYSHCQVPCGIYEDATRIYQIKEDFNTIKKAMFNIKELSKKDSPLSLNQATRWINTKEEHATKIQNRISDYFLIQRIKVKKGKEFDLYSKQITTLHQIMVLSMKCKQTLDTKNVSDALKQLDTFVDLYFDEHGKDHIKQIGHH